MQKFEPAPFYIKESSNRKVLFVLVSALLGDLNSFAIATASACVGALNTIPSTVIDYLITLF